MLGFTRKEEIQGDAIIKILRKQVIEDDKNSTFHLINAIQTMNDNFIQLKECLR